MTVNEFFNLKEGDEVRLPFSNNPVQEVIAIDKNNSTVTTRPACEKHISYVNDFNSIEIIPKVTEKSLDVKAEILLHFDNFKKNGCNDCPFRQECDDTYNEIRMSTTEAFTLCDALKANF